MANEMELKQARDVFDTICKAMDGRDLKYDKNEEELAVNVNFSGEDLPIQLILLVDAERQLIRLISPLTFKMSEEKRVEGALVTSLANYRLADGSFDYDLSAGTIIFRMATSYRESLISTELVHYLISVAYVTVEEYNDRFMMVSKGMMSISDFIEKN